MDSDESNNYGSIEGIETKKKGKESATDLSQLLLTEKVNINKYLQNSDGS